MASPPPFVRVEDAALTSVGGPARLVLARLPHADEIADAVAAARGVSRRVGERLVVTAGPARLIDAAGRVGGVELAERVRAGVEPAVDAWHAGAPDLDTPAGAVPTSQRPVVVGVLNITPDSFSDGGEFFTGGGHPDDAIKAGRAFAAAGADVIDVGGESTRPGAEPVDADQELQRVVPVVEALASEGLLVSVDTTKAVVARAAVEAGAAIVNDISAGTLDDDLWPTVAALGVPYVLMHMQGTPATMQDDPQYTDVVGEVFDFLADRLVRLEDGGVPRERVIVDPGIGFGKTVTHNLTLLHRLRDFTSLGRPVLVGASRKSFIGRLTNVSEPSDRVEGSVAVAALAAAAGARLIRVHDVAATVRAVTVAHAIATS